MSEKLDAEALERRLRLWFFRDLSADQRQSLFRLCGYPVDEIGQSHNIQLRSLRHLIDGLTSLATWECKDYADGWIVFPTLSQALEYQRETGCVMRPVASKG